jgi:CMP-N-acetylneuraminic acid synthetase
MIGKTQQKCIAFLPCRKGSERVENKNTKRFANIDGGLISIKLNQLLSVDEIDEIFLTTNDDSILEYASSLGEERVIIDQRDEDLCSSSTSTDELIQYAANNISEGILLWTHVTSPFVTTRIYEDAIRAYSDNVISGNSDSLMSVNEIHKFIWSANSPVNYDRKIEKWPRTQTLSALYEVNSAIFMADSEIYRSKLDRIGENPYMMTLSNLIAHDIDWEEDWTIAEQIYLNEVCKI